MSQERTAASAARSVGSGAARLLRAWRALPPERRPSAYAALGLFLTLFLPWYQRHFFVVIAGKPQPSGDSQTGWAAFSFVEAAVLLVAVGVLTLLFHRAEGRSFHLPGGDGGVIMVAGLWSGVLVVWRIFDKQGANSHQQYVTTSGIEWGIFVALAVASFLAYSGSRIRAAHRPEPPLPGDADVRAGDVVARPAAPPPRAEPEQWGSEDDPPTTPRSGRGETPPRPVPARPPGLGSASERRTGWLTAPPEGWTEDPDTARREPTRSWSHADDLAEEPPLRKPPPPPEDETPPTQSLSGGREDTQDAPDPPTMRIVRRRKQQPNDQLTIRLDRDKDT